MHNLPYGWAHAGWRVSDPGASGTFDLANKGRAVAYIETAAAEGRTVPAPFCEEQELVVVLDTDGGDLTLTVTDGATGATSITLNDAGDLVHLRAIKVAGALAWQHAKGKAGAALTTQLTTITHTAAGTPDYALQNLVQNTGFGFVTADEGNTTLAVIANLQTRMAELESRLQGLQLLS